MQSRQLAPKCHQADWPNRVQNLLSDISGGLDGVLNTLLSKFATTEIMGFTGISSFASGSSEHEEAMKQKSMVIDNKSLFIFII